MSFAQALHAAGLRPREIKADLPTADYVRSVLDYDQATGVFTWKSRPHQRRFAGKVAGSLDRDGYVVIRLNHRSFKAGRLAILWMTGAWPLGEVDHRDTDHSNNRWLNLRDVANQVNQQNHRRAPKNSKSGLLGVRAATNGRFQARIFHDGTRHCLGYFDTAEAAHAAYVDAKRRLHEGCTL